MAKDMVAHLKEQCPDQKVDCPKCQMGMKRKELEAHECLTAMSEKIAQIKIEFAKTKELFGLNFEPKCSQGH
jgi:hypothetical protein